MSHVPDPTARTVYLHNGKEIPKKEYDSATAGMDPKSAARLGYLIRTNGPHHSAKWAIDQRAKRSRHTPTASKPVPDWGDMSAEQKHVIDNRAGKTVVLT